MLNREILPTSYIFDIANRSMWRHDRLPCSVDHVRLYSIKPDSGERVDKKIPPKNRRVLVVLNSQEKLTEIYYSKNPAHSHKDLEEWARRWTEPDCIYLKGAIVSRETIDERNKNKHDVFVYENRVLGYQTIREIITIMRADLLIFREAPVVDGITIDVHLQQVSDRLGIEAERASQLAPRLVKIEALMNGV